MVSPDRNAHKTCGKRSVRATFFNEYVDTYISCEQEIGYSPTTGATLTYFENIKQQ
ncbi:hypothetical protein KAM546c_26540 [Enterobacter roggenkampii]|uniref:Integrase n=1 Tax=Enterobacter roggenkampii TaxID=1812935 RepID=A0AAU9BRE4_9ENTR|nr:hypothetical protein OIPHN260_28130 [Enterobacter roggenkampii]BDS21393.1 hypothetical protein KAM546c_26540 [Enterobacter roggenkampii]GJK12896.1 hypothetical protein TUM16664_06690 [Enterobacter cloacae]